MAAREYCKYAKEYGTVDHPVIVTDRTLEAHYFNPAAASDSTIRLWSDVIRRFITPRIALHLKRCRGDRKKQRFSMNLGLRQTRIYDVTMTVTKTDYIFELMPRPASQQKSRLRCRCERTLATTLPRLLNNLDTLAQNDIESIANTALSGRKELLRTLQITHPFELLSRIDQATPVHLPALIEELAKEYVPFLSDVFSLESEFSVACENGNAKCDLVQFRYVFYTVLAVLAQHQDNKIFIHCCEEPDDVCLSLSLCPYEDLTDDAISVSVEALALECSAELMQAQEGELTAFQQNGRLFFRLKLPKVDSGGVLRHRMHEYVRTSLPVLEIAFADLTTDKKE